MRKHKILFIVLAFMIGSTASIVPQGADLLAFSCNRPIQLYAFLESLEKYVTGLSSIQVIYRSDKAVYDKGYQIVKDRFNGITFIKQDPAKNRTDFKPLLLKALFTDSSSPYFLCAVDDMIVTEPINICECVRLLQKHNAYGFFLRLGRNITQCYTLTRRFNLPPLTAVEPEVLQWNFAGAPGDWGQPVSTDMCIFRKQEHQETLKTHFYLYPNDFEMYWIAASDKTKKGLCHTYSKVLNIPMNLVQETQNRNMDFLSADELNMLFLDGYKVDISTVATIPNTAPLNNAPHIEYVPQFIKR